MPELDVSTDVAEAFLGPLVADWNRLALDELDSLQESALRDDPRIKVSYGGAVRTPYGYEYLEFHFEYPTTFALCCRVEGTHGQLSFQTHHPVIQVQGDAARAAQWVIARAAQHCRTMAHP